MLLTRKKTASADERKQNDKAQLLQNHVKTAKERAEDTLLRLRRYKSKRVNWRMDEDRVSGRMHQFGNQQALVRQQNDKKLRLAKEAEESDSKIEKKKSVALPVDKPNDPKEKNESHRERVRENWANLSEETRRRRRKQEAERQRLKFWKSSEEERNVIRKRNAEKGRLRRVKLNAKNLDKCPEEAAALALPIDKPNDPKEKNRTRREKDRARRAKLSEEERQQRRKKNAESERLRRAKLNEEQYILFRKQNVEAVRLHRAKLIASNPDKCRKEWASRKKIWFSKLSEEERILNRKLHAEAQRLRRAKLNEKIIFRRVKHAEIEREKRAKLRDESVLPLLTDLPKGRERLNLTGEGLFPNDKENDNSKEHMVQIERLQISVKALKNAGLELIKKCAESAVESLKGGKVLSDRRRGSQPSNKTRRPVYKHRQRDLNSSRELFPFPRNNYSDQFVCIVCNDEFDTQGELKCHFAHHSEVEMSTAKEKFALNISEDDCRSKSQCLIFLTTYKCEICSQKCYTPTNYRKHIAEKHKENKELVKKMCYPCSFCDEIFIVKHAFKVHQRQFHNIFTQCPVCRENFVSQESFAKHVEESHTDCQKKTENILEYAEGFLCKVCGFYSRYYKSVLSHSKEAHSEREYFQCEICEEKCSSKNSLSRHKGKAHSEKLFCCELCGKQFHKTETLRSHKRAHKIGTTLDVIKKVECKECRKTFASKSSYRVHYLSAHQDKRPCQCTICGKTFTCPSSLHQHKITVCEKDRAWAKTCPTCGKSLDNYLLLYYHKTNIHKYGNTEENVCHLCKKTFRNPLALYSHNRAIHNINNQKPVELKCSICDKIRPNKKSLLEHWRLHREEQPFKCNLCKGKFKGAHQFYVHKKIDHQNQKSMAKLITDSEVEQKVKADFNEAHAIQFSKYNITDGCLKSTPENESTTTTITERNNLLVNNIPSFQNGSEEISDGKLGRNKNYIDFSRANIPVSSEVQLEIVEQEESVDNFEPGIDCETAREASPDKSGVDCETARVENITEKSSLSQENSNVVDEQMESADDFFGLLDLPYFDNDFIEIDEKPFIYENNMEFKDPFEKQLMIKIEILDECQDCSEVFSSSDGYKNHLSSIGHRAAKDPFEKWLMVEIERLDECQVCFQVFSSTDVYKKHLKSKGHRASVRARKRAAILKAKLEKKEKVKSDKEKARRKKRKAENALFTCPFCDEKLGSIKKYRMHTAQHRKRAKCLICSEKFVSLRKLVDHYNSEHKGEHIIKCEICDLGFLKYKSSHLQKHMRDRHGKNKRKKVKFITRYSCDICGEKMIDYKLFRRHILSHKSDEHKCVHCAKEFKVLIELENHYNETHNGEMPFSCTNCRRKFPTQITLQLHEKKNHGKSQKDKLEGKELISCSFCNEKFASVDKYRQHQVQHQKRASCLICTEIFPTVRKLVDHYISDHNGEKIVKCEICGKPFLEYQERNLREHMTAQHGGEKKKKSRVEKNYSCDVCGETIKGGKLFKIHLLSHKDEKHRCLLCSQELKSLVQLEGHYNETHNGEMPFPCRDCPLKFPIQIRLELHQKVAHSKENIRDPQDRKFVCDDCGKRFQNKCDLVYHKTTHDSMEMRLKLFCEFCGKSFVRAHSLTIHRREHTGEKPYPCTFCEMAFISPAILKQHVDTLHIKNSHLCDTCGKSFHRRKSLVRHHKVHYSAKDGSKPGLVPCPICFEIFAKPGALEKHMKLHDPNRPFGCDQCSWRFMHSSNLNLHKKGVHQKMGTVYPKKKNVTV